MCVCALVEVRGRLVGAYSLLCVSTGIEFRFSVLVAMSLPLAHLAGPSSALGLALGYVNARDS